MFSMFVACQISCQLNIIYYLIYKLIFLYIILYYKNIKFKHLIDGIGNFANMEDIRRKYNPMVNFSKFTSSKIYITQSYNQTLSFCQRNLVSIQEAPNLLQLFTQHLLKDIDFLLVVFRLKCKTHPLSFTRIHFGSLTSFFRSFQFSKFQIYLRVNYKLHPLASNDTI